MFGRMLRSVAAASLGWFTVQVIPDIARYLRIRQPDPQRTTMQAPRPESAEPSTD